MLRVALITGSTSGIGEGIAYRLASLGHAIVLTGFGTKEQISNVTDECVKRGSPRVEYCEADLADVSQIQKMFENVNKLFGKGPDILVNNAGTEAILRQCAPALLKCIH